VAEHDRHRAWSQLDELLATAPLEPAVAAGARSTFRRLADAEAAVHGIDVDEVHFHEVGALDAVVDIVGSWAALHSLVGAGADRRVGSGPVGLGTGVTTMAHGTVPVPAPAVLELLRGVPVVAVPVAAETATPTGVALLVTMAGRWGDLPDGVLARAGRGAGTRDDESHANVLTGVLLDTRAPTGRVPAVLLETNVDDVSPETVAYVLDLLLARGADDAWATPVVMKKGRPAQVLSVLCRPELADRLRSVLVAETGSLGVRQRVLDKFELERHDAEVVLEGQHIRIKVGPHGAKPEHEDVAAAARRLDRPLRDVAAAALARWHQS
jgi:uncharacterized protein (TIGR00299 family) protein